MPWTAHRRPFLSSRLSRCGRFLCSLLLKVLADYLVMRLVTILLTTDRLLLLHLPGIPIS